MLRKSTVILRCISILIIDNNQSEAVFYPYNPDEDPVLIINIRIGNDYKDVKCPLSLKGNFGFEGRKIYRVAIKISGTSLGTLSAAIIDESANDNYTVDLSDKKILWIGNSISKGSTESNYPQLVADALKCQVVNNSQNASFVTFDSTPPFWTTYEEMNSNYYREAFSLSATPEETDDKFRSILTQLYEEGQFPADKSVDSWLSYYKEQSYEKIILPYIDGRKNSCDVIIIDHGFSDYKAIIRDNEKGYDKSKQSYIGAMSFLIEECRKVNQNIKIIIGNYFASVSPMSEWWDCCELMLEANKAVAEMHDLNIVNVYEYTGIDTNDEFIEFIKDNDYTHPEPEGNQIIASIYTYELKRIFDEK